ncbi:MAG: malonyl-CoA decarboxylase [Acidobacteriia bacterium]|nr:malonyl-CoA decarboxylase [Methyloceanibacter sp.]MCL6491149.1 malonyl-CoA decarboxylase [Terriglobia bacterium]
MSEIAAPTGLLDRAIRRITSVWREMASGVGREDDDSIEGQMRACLAGRGGEVSARNRAAKLAETYLRLDTEGRHQFLRTLASFDADQDAVETALAELQAANDATQRAHAQMRLRRALEPRRIRLLTQFTTIPDGIKFLVDLRATVLDMMANDPELVALDADLRGLLANWFDVGFLELRRIDWSSPATLLEKLVGYEAVHEIRSWRDLKNRLDSDRRCYAFFHPRMPDEPLIFVEVALVEGIVGNVQRLLDEKAPLQDPHTADTAIFYSISNCHRGLSGISFGNFLIKRVVGLLSDEFRNLKTFATLSPVPGFRRWLDARMAEGLPGFFSEDEAAAIRAAAPGEHPTPEAALAAILAERGWYRNANLVRAVEAPMLRLCARYLLQESRGKRALDPVAHFHLTNGARLERINILGDRSEKGARESATVMVNYLYDPAKIEEYHEAYVGEGRRHASSAVRRLLRS